MNMRAVIAVIAALVLIASCVVTGPAIAVQNECCEEPTIQVTGTGKVTTDPDRAIVSLAVETEGEDVKVAQQENAVRMNRVIEALQDLGIPDEDLKTTGYSIYSVTEDERGPFDRDKTVYRVTNTLQVTLNDILMVGEVIDVAINNGANRVNYISFTLSDEKQEELRADALFKAVAMARADADAVASAMGISIIGVKQVNVGGFVTPIRYAEATFVEAPMAAPQTSIEPGTVDVTASVSILYTIG
jgi:uncharacterized protein YggE